MNKPAIRVTTNASLRVMIYGIFLLAFLTQIFGSTANTGHAWMPGLIIAFLATPIAHEIVHGLAFSAFGGTPKYGVGFMALLPVAYATAPGYKFTKLPMLIIGLAPLFTITPLAILVSALSPSLAPYMVVIIIANTAGAIGDLWLCSQLVKYWSVPTVAFEDQKDLMFVTASTAQDKKLVNKIYKRLEEKEAKRDFFGLWIKASFVLAVIIIAIPVLYSAVAPGQSLQVGPNWLPIVSISTGPSGGVTTDINVIFAALGGLAFALLKTIHKRAR